MTERQGEKEPKSCGTSTRLGVGADRVEMPVIRSGEPPKISDVEPHTPPGQPSDGGA